MTCCQSFHRDLAGRDILSDPAKTNLRTAKSDWFAYQQFDCSGAQRNLCYILGARLKAVSPGSRSS